MRLIIESEDERCEEVLKEFSEEFTKEYNKQIKKLPKYALPFVPLDIEPVIMKEDNKFVLVIPFEIPRPLSWIFKIKGEKKLIGNLEGYLKGKGIEFKKIEFKRD